MNLISFPSHFLSLFWIGFDLNLPLDEFGAVDFDLNLPLDEFGAIQFNTRRMQKQLTN